jgi:hypothetical protein
MKDSEKLIKRIHFLYPNINIPSDVKIHRTYAGINQKNCGAWSSVYTNGRGTFEIGLYVSCRELLRCPNLIVQQSYFNHSALEIDCNCKGKCKGGLG